MCPLYYMYGSLLSELAKGQHLLLGHLLAPTLFDIPLLDFVVPGECVGAHGAGYAP